MRLVLHLRHKAHALTGKRPNDRLCRAAVANRPACGVDPAVYRRIRDDAPAPDMRDQIVFADDAFAVLDQIGDEVENLRFERDRHTIARQLAPLCIELVVAEAKPHLLPRLIGRLTQQSRVSQG